MKKILKIILILIIIMNFLVMLLQCTTGVNNSKNTTINVPMEKDKLQQIKEKGVITAATPLNDISFFYKDDESGKIRGIDAEIVTEIARRLGINRIDMEQSLFVDLLERLNTNDSIDIAAGGIYITPGREKIVSFTEALYKGGEAIVVPTYSRFNFLSDLKNAVVGVEKGTVFVGMADKWKQDNRIKDVVIFDNSSQLLSAISGRKVDAGIIDSVIVKYSLLKDKSLLLRILKDYTPEFSGNVGIAMRKNDIALLHAFNEKIDEMREDGTLYAILIQNGLDKSNMIGNQ